MVTQRVMGDEPGHGQALRQVSCAGRDVLGRTSTLEALSVGQERYDVCAAERAEGSKIAWLRTTMEQDVDLSAVSAVLDVSSADGR